MDSLSDVGGLLLQSNQDVAGLVVEAFGMKTFECLLSLCPTGGAGLEIQTHIQKAVGQGVGNVRPTKAFHPPPRGQGEIYYYLFY